MVALRLGQQLGQQLQQRARRQRWGGSATAVVAWPPRPEEAAATERVPGEAVRRGQAGVVPARGRVAAGLEWGRERAG